MNKLISLPGESVVVAANQAVSHTDEIPRSSSVSMLSDFEQVKHLLSKHPLRRPDRVRLEADKS